MFFARGQLRQSSVVSSGERHILGPITGPPVRCGFAQDPASRSKLNLKQCGVTHRDTPPWRDQKSTRFAGEITTKTDKFQATQFAQEAQRDIGPWIGTGDGETQQPLKNTWTTDGSRAEGNRFIGRGLPGGFAVAYRDPYHWGVAPRPAIDAGEPIDYWEILKKQDIDDGMEGVALETYQVKNALSVIHVEMRGICTGAGEC